MFYSFTLQLQKYIFIWNSNKFAWGIRYSNLNACFLKCFINLVFLTSYRIHISMGLEKVCVTNNVISSKSHRWSLTQKRNWRFPNPTHPTHKWGPPAVPCAEWILRHICWIHTQGASIQLLFALKINYPKLSISSGYDI